MPLCFRFTKISSNELTTYWTYSATSHRSLPIVTPVIVQKILLLTWDVVDSRENLSALWIFEPKFSLAYLHQKDVQTRQCAGALRNKCMQRLHWISRVRPHISLRPYGANQVQLFMDAHCFYTAVAARYFIIFVAMLDAGRRRSAWNLSRSYSISQGR